MVYKQVRINITRDQLKKAIAGKPIRLLSSQLGNGEILLSLHPANIKIVEKAAMKGAGCNIYLSPGELMSSAEDMNGEGVFGDIWSGLKSGYNWVKKNVVDTPLYQQNIKPIVRGFVNKGVAMAENYDPRLGQAARLAADKIGKETGAFGLKKRGCTKAARMSKLRGKGLYLS